MSLTKTRDPKPALAALTQARRSRTARISGALAILGVLAFALVAINLLLGNFTVTILDFFQIVAGKNIHGASFIVMQNKLPRTLLGLLVGAAFGLSGCLFQTLLRNPLASPDIIGISGGASAATIIAIVFFNAGGLAVSVAAVIGALALALFVLWLAGPDNGNRMILLGIGVAAMMNAVILFVMQRAPYQVAQQALAWLVGSLNSASWERVTGMIVTLVVLVPVILVTRKALGVLPLGDDLASGLGIQVRRSRTILFLIGVVLAAVGTAVAGPIAFVAFLSAPIARMLLGGRTSLWASALVGAAIVLGADYIGAYLLADTVLPVGIITGIAGAPFLLALLIRGNKRAQA